MPAYKTVREQLPSTDRRQEFSSRPYPKPALERVDPDLESISQAFDTLKKECDRIYNGSATAADQEHANFIRAKLDQVRRMVRGRIEKERKDAQMRMFG